jgi:hypothetical protein
MRAISGKSALHTEGDMAMVAAVSAGDVSSGVGLGGTSISSTTVSNWGSFDSIFTSHRQVLNKNRGRGTSLERTEREKRIQELSKGIYNTNPGDTGMTAAVTPLSPTSPTSITSNEPTDGPRAEYRSWRDVKIGAAAEKTWSIGGQRDDNRHGGQVEKSIQDALAGVEPNTRSRKASHSLGFFKEGLPDDGSRTRDSKNRGRSNEGRSRGKPSVSVDHVGRWSGHGSSPSEHPNAQGWTRSVDRKNPLESTLGSKQTTVSHEHETVNMIENLATDPGYFDSSHNIETMSEAQVKAIPDQLLADIRDHNLTPGAAKGSSFSRSIPVTASEKEKAEASKEDSAPHGDDNVLEKNELMRVKSADEEEDSGEEQIASALFVPHQTPHDSPEGEREGIEGISRSTANDQQKAEVPASQQWLEEHEVHSDELPENYRREEIKNQPPPGPQADLRPSHDVVTSTSLPEDLSDAQSEVLAESYKTEAEKSGLDDGETTPTALKPAMTLESASTELSRDSEGKAKQPLDAIELIPYRHQVGGHTTMWRFSKRAVCKQLNNRENEFYEKVERFHPKLLQFLPRYVFFIPFLQSYLTDLEAESCPRPSQSQYHTFDLPNMLTKLSHFILDILVF